MSKEWKHWEHPEMNFIHWGKLLMGFWYEPRDAVQQGDFVLFLMNSWKVAKFRIESVRPIPNSRDALVLQLSEVGYVEPSPADKAIIDRLKMASEKER